MRNKILGIALCTTAVLSLNSCGDYLETNSPSTVTAQLATSSIDGCQTTMEGAYENFHKALRDQVLATVCSTPWMPLDLISSVMVVNRTLVV